MRKKRHSGLYGEVPVRAMQDALYERLIDRCWDELKEVFRRPDVQAAEGVIMRAIAEAFAPNDKPSRRPRGKR